MLMRFEMSGQHQAVNVVVGYAPTEPSDSENKRAFWHRLDSLVQRIPKKECLFVLMDANARTGEKIEGERTKDDGVLGGYGRDELNNNGKRLLNFATDNKLAVTNTFFSTRKGGILHTYDGVIGDRAGDFKRIDYIRTRQAYRPRVHNVEVHPQPNRPIKADSDHNMVFATVDLGGRFAHNRRVRQTPQPRSFTRSQLKTRFLRERVIWKFVDNIDEIAGQRASVAEEAREFTEAILGRRMRFSRRRDGPHAGLGSANGQQLELRSWRRWKKSGRHADSARPNTPATWKALRAACKGVRAAIDKGTEFHLEEYVAELETLLRHRDMRGLYKHLKMTAGLGGRKPEEQQAIKDENGNLLRDKGDILRRWERFFGNLFNTKSPALQPSIVEKV